ncbi:ComEC/Rec2 family competence protein [Gallintestinimicrobium sp.]|uniref:ComEC/Rec2 family competence protein n=1 Tax=Gallintestinimicrobium sp. TaxID=2981655 RepID=UPI003AB6C02D
MGTDAGTDTSEKASIGGCTSLTQLDTWLEAMDGETLCLTGKVTDCWQPVDGAQENASFYLKDLSIEADASSFVFSGDSAETTDNLSQISGSADADQMSILISSQKTTSQINEMQEIFGKNASTLCYLQEDEALPKAGSYVRVFGEVSPFLQATNPGEFDTAAYYRRKDCLFALRKTKITAQTKNYGRLEEFLSQLRYESEALFRKLLGEKNGATASAMVLGRKKGMDSEVKALYQGAGISHLLAISGLHLSLIGAGLFGLLKKVRLPVALSAGISTWILIVYAQLTGMGISTRRALIMFLLFLAAGLLKRTPDLPTSLAVAALLLLVPKPQRILDAGFQLSFSAVIGIAVMIPVLQDGWEEAAPSLRVADGVAGWNIARAAIVRACCLLRKNILAGLGITMTMLPFLLIHFYEWSPWSVLLNLAVIPLMGILLPCLIGLQLVARLTAFVHCLEIPQHLLCTAIEAIFSCYEQLCRFTTALPGSILHTGYPTWQALAVYTIGLIALAVSGKKLRPHLRLAAAVCLMGIFLIRLPGELNVTMLDVGQGECVGIETREHHVYLVDAGSTSKKKTGQYQIIPWLKYIGTRSVEGIFITHWDEDHISAVGELLEWSKSSRVKIRRIFLPDVALKDEVLETLLQQIEEAEVSVEYLSAGEHMTDGALQISCLHPYAKKVPEDRNDASLVLRLSQGDFQMLLTGDLEKSGEDWLVEQVRPAVEQPQPAAQEQALPCAPSTQPAAQNPLRCTILDAGHHGASNATGEALLDLAQPELVLISCGKNNRYGHPAPETLKRLEEREIRWYSTAEVGAIQVYVGKKKVKIETSRSGQK